MTLRQKQKVAVLFTKVSTLTPKNVQPPAAGTPSSERPQKRRILLGAQDVYTLRIWCRSPHAFPRYGLRNISRLTSMQKKNSTPAPGAPMGRSSTNYVVPVPGVYSTLSQNLTPIAPFCVEIFSAVQTNKKQTKTKNKCVSRTDTNPPFAFQTAFPRGTDFTVFLQGGSKSYIRCL